MIAPRRSVALEWVVEMHAITTAMGFSIDFETGMDVLKFDEGKTICVTTPSHLIAALSQLPTPPSLPGLRLVICDSLEQLDPSYELSVSLLRHATQTQATRFVGFSNSLNDPADLAAWLNVDSSALYSFRPGDRDQSLSVTAHTFAIPQSAALFKAMTKPAHAAIRAVPDSSAIVFVPSRGQCRMIALDLITHCALEMEAATGYLPHHVDPESLEPYTDRLQDRGLVDFITKGVGFFHEGINKSDRRVMLELYAEGIVRVLLVPHNSCWTLPVRAAAVIVMGTQYVHMEGEGADLRRQVRDYDLEELVRMQGRAVHHGELGRFHLFCQAEDKDTYMRFLEDGLPLESQLLDGDELRRWYHGRRQDGSIRGKMDGVQALAFTFLARRLVTNPAYYDADTRDQALSRIVDKLEE